MVRAGNVQIAVSTAGVESKLQQTAWSTGKLCGKGLQRMSGRQPAVF